MEFRTKVALPSTDIHLNPDTGILFIGSCFARRIGEKLRAHGLQAAVNPFGVLYNPESMALALECAMGLKNAEHYSFKGNDGLWHNWLFSSEVSASSETELSAAMTQRMEETRKFIDRNVLCLTFGTTHVYRLKEENLIVGNCHKEAGHRFETLQLGVADITDRWRTLLKEILTLNPNLHIVMTVSPYRYMGYGFHENTISKSTLHLAIAGLCETFSQCHYFPAYEIVLDELRDYRFYDADMLHPSAVAVDYIWERFAEWCFTDDTKAYIKDYLAIMRDRLHRPLHPESENYKRFLTQTEERLHDFEKKWHTTIPHTPSTH